MTVWGSTRDKANHTIRCQTWVEVEQAKAQLRTWTRVTGWMGEVIELNDKALK